MTRVLVIAREYGNCLSEKTIAQRSYSYLLVNARCCRWERVTWEVIYVDDIVVMTDIKAVYRCDYTGN